MKLWSTIRKIAVIVAATPVIVIGLILIPLPGPGVLITLLGFMILGIEFEFARRYSKMMYDKLKSVVDASFRKFDERMERLD